MKRIWKLLVDYLLNPPAIYKVSQWKNCVLTQTVICYSTVACLKLGNNLRIIEKLLFEKYRFKETFPDNLTAVFNRNMMPIVAHNRYFSPYNVYAKENGGTFDFILEDNIAIPADARLWKFLFQQSKVWGLTTYEQVLFTLNFSVVY